MPERMRSEIREIISNFAWQIHYKQCDGLYIENKGIDQATSQIMGVVEKEKGEKNENRD